jgi:hypothetical protein
MQITPILRRNITIAPTTDEYSRPSGPKSKARMMASPILLVDKTTTIGGSGCSSDMVVLLMGAEACIPYFP